jgi:hypothetical protein
MGLFLSRHCQVWVVEGCISATNPRDCRLSVVPLAFLTKDLIGRPGVRGGSGLLLHHWADAQV